MKENGSLTNRASGFYMLKDIIFQFQGKGHSVKALLWSSCFCLWRLNSLCPKGIIPSPVYTAFICFCIEEWWFQVIIKIILWPEQIYQASIHWPPTSFCIMLLCYFQRGLNRIFRGKKCFFFRSRKVLSDKVPCRPSVHWRWSLHLDKELCVTLQRRRGVVCSPPSVSRAGTCWKVICLSVLFSFRVSFLWLVIISTIYNFGFSL